MHYKEALACVGYENCHYNYRMILSKWMYVMVLVYFFYVSRRIVIIVLWKFKEDPHNLEMVLNAMSFATLGLFEAGWAIFYNMFVWRYISWRFNEKTEKTDVHNLFKDWIMIPIIVISWFNMLKNILIILMFGLLAFAGWITGYWVFDKDRAQRYNDEIEAKEVRANSSLRFTNNDF